jgi:hypothetical protein
MYIDDSFYDAYVEGAKKSGTPLTPDELKNFINSLPPDDQKYWGGKISARGDHGLTKEFIDGIGDAEITQSFLDRLQKRSGGLTR